MEQVLLEWGPPGVIIFVLLNAIRVLYAQNVALQKDRNDDLKEMGASTFATVEVLKRAIEVIEGRGGRGRE